MAAQKAEAKLEAAVAGLNAQMIELALQEAQAVGVGHAKLTAAVLKLSELQASPLPAASFTAGTRGGNEIVSRRRRDKGYIRMRDQG